MRNIVCKKVISGTLLFIIVLCLIIMPIGEAYAHRGMKVAMNQESDNNGDNNTGFVAKDETVYVILDHDGKALEKRVVNHIYGEGKLEEIRDYGHYKEVKNMETSDKPRIYDGQIIWDGKLLDSGDIFFEGITDKELPIEVSIRYFLDGKEVEAKSLAGKSGNLRIEMEVTNKLEMERPITYESCQKGTVSKEYEHYVPFLVQVSYPVDLNIFSHVKADQAVKVVTGKTMNLSFAVFPYPHAQVAFEMRGSNIELKPITFTVIPQVPPVPDVDMEDELLKMLNGVREIRDGLNQFDSAMLPLKSGGRKIAEGKQAVEQGVSALVKGSDALAVNADELVTGLDSSAQGFKELKDGIMKLAEGLNGVAAGVNSLAGAAGNAYSAVNLLAQAASQLQAAVNVWTQSMVPGLLQVININEEMLAIAQKLIQEQPEGSDLYKLGSMVIEQNKVIEAIGGTQGLIQGGAQFAEAAGKLKEGVDRLKEGLDTQFIPGFQKVNSSIDGLASGAKVIVDGMEEYQRGQTAYRQGLVEYVKGVKGISSGLNVLSGSLTEMFTGMDSLVKVLDEMDDGLNAMDSQGLSKMEESIVQAIDDMRFAKALKQRMEELANSYRSFMDNERNINSSVQFIMRTREIESQEAREEKKVQQSEPKNNFWKQLLELFGL